MTTQEAITELKENISSYPDVHTIVIHKHGVIGLKSYDNGYIEFSNGTEMLEWMESKYLDENGNLIKK